MESKATFKVVFDSKWKTNPSKKKVDAINVEWLLRVDNNFWKQAHLLEVHNSISEAPSACN